MIALEWKKDRGLHLHEDYQCLNIPGTKNDILHIVDSLSIEACKGELYRPRGILQALAGRHDYNATSLARPKN